VPDAEYEAAVSKAVDDIVRKQIEVGVDIIDDGEQSKAGSLPTPTSARRFEPYKRPAGTKPFAVRANCAIGRVL